VVTGYSGVLPTGLGYCALRNGEVASICCVSFRTHDTDVLGIETVAQYRRRGLARYVAAACAEDVLRNGRRAYWDCEVDNIASAATAESVGFEKAWEYRCYAFRI